MHSKVSAFLLAAFLLGCTKSDPHLPGYKVASGDATAFILKSAASFGARPVKTGGLPKLEGEWRYKADTDGIQIYLIGDRLSQVQSLLLEAFGPPAIPPKTNESGQVSMGLYAAPTVGAAIQFLRDDLADGSRYTQILIVRAGAIKP
jgi:hypothetical protein